MSLYDSMKAVFLDPAALPAALTDGQSDRVRTGADRVLLVRDQTPPVPIAYSQIGSMGDAISLVVKATPGILYELDLSAGAIATHWIQFFDLVALPANGTAPDFPPFQMFTTSSLSWRGTFTGSTGIVVAASTTRATLTAAGAAVVWINARYI